MPEQAPREFRSGNRAGPLRSLVKGELVPVPPPPGNPPYPPPQEQPYPPKPPGLLAALADTRFTILATPLVVRWIYLGCAATIAVMTVFFFILAWWVASWRNGWLYGLMGMVAAPMIGFILLLVVRVACEFTLTRFRR